MSDAAAISAVFADFKSVKTRSTVQIVLEVPIEGADQVLKALGGYPQPGKEVPVAVARLTAAPEPEQPVATHEKRPWHELKPSQQAGIRCADPAFCRWALAHASALEIVDLEPGMNNETATAQWVRKTCGVESRAAFDKYPDLAATWARLDAKYLEDTQLPEQTG